MSKTKIKINTNRLKNISDEDIQTVNKVLQNAAIKNHLINSIFKLMWEETYDVIYNKPHKNNAMFTDIPVKLGTSPELKAIKKYLNKNLFTYRVRWRGGRTKQTSKSADILWDFEHNPICYHDLPRILAERAHIYVETRKDSNLVLDYSKIISRRKLRKSAKLAVELLSDMTNINQ